MKGDGPCFYSGKKSKISNLISGISNYQTGPVLFS